MEYGKVHIAGTPGFAYPRHRIRQKTGFNLTIWSAYVLIKPMREAHSDTQARSRRAVLSPARGSTLSLPRVNLSGRVLALAAVGGLLAVLAGQGTAAAAAPSPWIGLDSGRMGGFQWSVKAKHPGGRAGAGQLGAQRPCLLVGSMWQLGPYNFRRNKYRTCSEPTGRLAASEPPLIATSVQPTSATAGEMTAVGMLFAPAAARVRVTFTGGTSETIPLDQMTPTQAQAARLGRFHYAAFAVRGLWCPERLSTQDASGRTLWDSGPEPYTC
jgi:hypothetical protein